MGGCVGKLKGTKGRTTSNGHKTPNVAECKKLDRLRDELNAYRDKFGFPPIIVPDPPGTDRQKALMRSFGKCPDCGSTDLDASDYDGGRDLSMQVTCGGCGLSWYEHYRFVGSSDFEGGQEDEEDA